MKHTIGFLLILLTAACALGQSPKPKPKPDFSHGYWMAVNEWDDGNIEYMRSQAFNYFVQRNGNRADYDTFEMCVVHIPLQRHGGVPDPTPAHVRQCDRVIDRLTAFLDKSPQW